MAVHAAVFLITLSGLIFEIGLTRVYSATIWYHYTFIAVSVALLGWGLGGVVLHVLRRRIVGCAPFAVGDVDVSPCKKRRLRHSFGHRRHFGL